MDTLTCSLWPPRIKTFNHLTIALLPAMKCSKSTYLKLNLYKTNKPVGSLVVKIMDVAIKEEGGVFCVSSKDLKQHHTYPPLKKEKVNNEVLNF